MNDLEHEEEINSEPVQNEETGIFKKTRRELEDSGTSPNVPTSKS